MSYDQELQKRVLVYIAGEEENRIKTSTDTKQGLHYLVTGELKDQRATNSNQQKLFHAE